MGVRFVRGVKDEEDEDQDEDGDEEDEDAEGETEDEEEEPRWLKAAREPVFECRVQKGGRGKKGGSDGALNGKIADKEVESSGEDEDEDEDDSAEDEDEDEEDEDDAVEEQNQIVKNGKRAKPEASSDEGDSGDDDVVVPSRKRARR